MPLPIAVVAAVILFSLLSMLAGLLLLVLKLGMAVALGFVIYHALRHE